MLVTEHLLERSALSPFAIRDIAFIPNLGIVSCFVSKNASSFLKTYLSCLARDRPFSPPSKNPHMPANTGFQGVEQLGHKRMSEILRDNSVPKILLGRHPVSRLISAYQSRVLTWQRETYDSHNRSEWILLRQQITGHVQGSHASHPVAALTERLSWEEVLLYVVKTPSAELDRHLVPQTYFAGVDMIEYDLLGQVENLHQFLSEVHELLGKPRLSEQLPPINRTRPHNEEEQIRITNEDIRKIVGRYGADFDYFGYKENP